MNNQTSDKDYDSRKLKGHCNLNKKIPYFLTNGLSIKCPNTTNMNWVKINGKLSKIQLHNSDDGYEKTWIISINKA